MFDIISGCRDLLFNFVDLGRFIYNGLFGNLYTFLNSLDSPILEDLLSLVSDTSIGEFLSNNSIASLFFGTTLITLVFMSFIRFIT